MAIPLKEIPTIPLKAKVNIRAFAGIAKPNPKMGQALGPHGINMMQFCKDFNAVTSHIKPDTPLKVKVYAFSDRTFSFIVKPPETSWFIKKAIGKEKCSKYPGHLENDVISVKYIYEIAKVKKEMDPDLGHVSLESICKSIASQCQTMGVGVYLEQDPPPVVKPPVRI